MKSVDNDHLMEATEPSVAAGPSLLRWPSLVNRFGHQMQRRGCTGNWTWERVPAEENSRFQKGGHARKEYRWPQRSHMREIQVEGSYGQFVRHVVTSKGKGHIDRWPHRVYHRRSIFNAVEGIAVGDDYCGSEGHLGEEQATPHLPVPERQGAVLRPGRRRHPLLHYASHTPIPCVFGRERMVGACLPWSLRTHTP